MNEYQKLLSRYGLTSATRNVLPSEAAPTDITDPNYAQDLATYTANQAEQQRYAGGFDQRSAAFDPYGPGWSGETLAGPQYQARKPRIVPQIVIDAVSGDAAKSPFSQPSGDRGDGSSTSGAGREPGAGVNDAFHSVQQAINTPMGEFASWAASKLGLLGEMQQDPTNVPVSDVQGTPVSAAPATWGKTGDPDRDIGPAVEGVSGWGKTGDADRDIGPAQSAVGAEAAGTRSLGATSAFGGFGGWGGESRDAAGRGGDNGDGGRDHGNSGSAPGGGAATGGLITHERFAQGGLAELNAKYAPPGMEGSGDILGNRGLDMSRVSPEQAAMMLEQDPEAMRRGVERFAAQPQPEPIARAQEPGLEQLHDRIFKEYESARGRSAAAQDKFTKLLEQQMSQETPGPSKAEMYFNLAAAFGAPTKTGSFSESLAPASAVMAKHNEAARTAKATSAAERRALGLTVAQAGAQSAKEEEAGLRQMSLEALKEKYRAGEPKSEAGKTAADRGLKRGTPEYAEFVSKYVDDKNERAEAYRAANLGVAQEGLALRQGQEERKAAEAKKLTTPEVKLKTETEDALASVSDAYNSLKKAMALNPNTFGGTLGDKAQRIILEQTQPKDKRVLDTREMENLLEKAALSSLKTTFPGAISNDERKALMDTQGLGAKSTDERKLIMDNAAKAMKSIYARHEKRLKDINAGTYRETSPETE